MKIFFLLPLIIIIIGAVLFSCSSGEDMREDKNLSKNSEEGSAFSQQENMVSTSSINKQNFTPTDTLNLKVTPFIPDYSNLGSSGKQLLSTRLNQAISNYTFGGGGGNPRFIIGPKINLLSKNLTGTSPTKYANTYEVTLFSLDTETETIFASYSFTVKGIGDSPAKAFINAFRKYSFETEDFFNFLSKTENKIAQFYNINCDKVLTEAKAEASTRNFDAAFALLESIPSEATDCFDKATDKRQKYFKLSLNTNCQALLANMKTELGKANDPSASGFNDAAMSYYAMIDRSSDCYKEAENIYQEYLKNLRPEVKRDWEKEMKAFEAEIAQKEREDAFKKDKMETSYDYLKHKEKMQAQAEIKGNKKLLKKYQYDQLPWLRKVFHLGEHDPFDGIDE